MCKEKTVVDTDTTFVTNTDVRNDLLRNSENVILLDRKRFRIFFLLISENEVAAMPFVWEL